MNREDLLKLPKKNDTRILELSFTPEQVTPKFLEKSNKEYVTYGDKNLYPNHLIELKNNCSTHGKIIENITQQIIGKGFKIKGDVEDKNLQSFIDTCNSKGESLFDVVSKITSDYILFGGWCTSIVWKRSTENFELYHTDFSTIRSGKVDSKGEVNEYFFSSNWGKHTPEYSSVKSFSTENRKGTELYYYKKYAPSNVYYPLPNYIGAINWILLDIKISEFFNSYLDSGCFPSLWVNYNNGIPDDNTKEAIYNGLLNEYQGSAQSGKIIVSFSEGKETAPEITPLNTNDDDTKFTNLSNLVLQQIITGWGITSPELIGIQVPGKLGSSSLIESQQLFFNTVILPKQNDILKELNYLLKQNGFKNEIEFIQTQPVEFSLSENTMTQILTINELRNLVGVEPLEDGDKLITPNTNNTNTNTPTA